MLFKRDNRLAWSILMLNSSGMFFTRVPFFNDVFTFLLTLQFPTHLKSVRYTFILFSQTTIPIVLMDVLLLDLVRNEAPLYE